jgi:hypothetical protein
MARHRKPDEFGDPDELTEQHPVIDVLEVDISDPSDPCVPIPVAPDQETEPVPPPRHERFEPLYRGGIDPHETEPITKVVAGGGEQIPWPLVPHDEPLVAERDPQPTRKTEHQHRTFVWAVTATVAAAGALGALVYALLMLHGGQPARCPTHTMLTPTVTVTAPAPP